MIKCKVNKTSSKTPAFLQLWNSGVNALVKMLFIKFVSTSRGTQTHAQEKRNIYIRNFYYNVVLDPRAAIYSYGQKTVKKCINLIQWAYKSPSSTLNC